MSKRQDALLTLTEMGLDVAAVDKELEGLDIEKEFRLIEAKNSGLSASKRRLVQAYHKKMQAQQAQKVEVKIDVPETSGEENAEQNKEVDTKTV